MPPKPRIEYPGAIYLVMDRGDQREDPPETVRPFVRRPRTEPFRFASAAPLRLGDPDAKCHRLPLSAGLTLSCSCDNLCCNWMPTTKLIFFREADGTAPVVEWLTQLRRENERAYAKCRVRLMR
jgi:hypothetical protein